MNNNANEIILDSNKKPIVSDYNSVRNEIVLSILLFASYFVVAWFVMAIY